MNKIKYILILTIASVLLLTSCKSYEPAALLAGDFAVEKNIIGVDGYPDLPQNYSYFDYRAKAEELDGVVFSFASNSSAKAPAYIADDPSTWFPIGYWIDRPRQPAEYNPLVTGYLNRTFGIPTYLGDNRVISSGAEALTVISMVLGQSYAGIDKKAQSIGGNVFNFAEMTLAGYDTGSKLVHNSGVQGQSFWYDIFPQIVFARLYDKYSDIPYMKEMVINGADQWLEALPYFVKDGVPNYEFVGYNVVLESPTASGGHIEPPNGGLAFLFYSAFEITKEQKYLDGAKEVLDYFETYQKNPNYEALTDYTPYVAAALNSKYGTSYDVGKYLDYLFEGDSAFRPGWSVMSGSFGSNAVDGLVGQGGDYAFAMNSFHLASTLAPMAKYDVRYSAAVGKYILNLVNNAKVFFPQSLSLSKQTMGSYLPQDKNGSICYEGFRNSYNGVTGYAMGDATAMFGQPSDLSLYSAAFVGMLGGLVSETNVKGILKIDLNNTDSFGRNDFANYLYYNPYATDKIVTFEGGAGRYDLFDAVSKRIVARNVSGKVSLAVPAKSSAVIAVLPAKSELVREGNYLKTGGVVIAEYKAAVNILNIRSRQELTSQSKIQISYSAPKSDAVSDMRIYFNEIEVYGGAPITEFSYDKSVLPDTDYTIKIAVTTANGLTDFCTKRVVAR